MTDEPTLVLIDGHANPDLVASMLDMPVHITEKVAGQHWEATITRNGPVRLLHGDDSRTTPRCAFFLKELLRSSDGQIDRITLRGVQHRLPFALGQEIFLFDIEIDGVELAPAQAFLLFDAWSMPHVPVLSAPGQTLGQWLDRRPLPVAAQGRSRLLRGDRQGVVVRPMEELVNPDFGRLIVKLDA